MLKPQIRLPSDFSTIQLDSLPSGIQPEAVIGILAVFGFTAHAADIHVKEIEPAGCIATVKFHDPHSAKEVVNKIENELNDEIQGELSVRLSRVL